MIIYILFSLATCGGPNDAEYQYVSENFTVFNQDSSHGVVLSKIVPTRGSHLINDEYVIHYTYCPWDSLHRRMDKEMKVGDSLFYDHKRKRFKLYKKEGRSSQDRVRFYSSQYCKY